MCVGDFARFMFLSVLLSLRLYTTVVGKRFKSQTTHICLLQGHSFVHALLAEISSGQGKFMACSPGGVKDIRMLSLQSAPT